MEANPPLCDRGASLPDSQAPGVPRPAGKRWKRISRWILFCTAGLLLLLALFVLVSYKTFQHFYPRMPDPILSYNVDRSLKAQITSPVEVQIEIDDSLPVRLSKVLEFEIPIKKDVEVLIDDDFSVPLELAFAVPIDQDVFVDTEVPVDTQMSLEGVHLRASLWGFKEVSLPLRGTMPVKISIPVRKPVHIQTQADVHLSKQVEVHLTKRLTLPLDLKVHVKLPINDVFDVRLTDGITVKARINEQIPVDVRLRLALSKDGTLTTE